MTTATITTTTTTTTAADTQPAPLEIGDYARAEFLANLLGHVARLEGVVVSIAEPHTKFNASPFRTVSVVRADGTGRTSASTMPVHRLHPAGHPTAQAAIRQLLASHAWLSDRARAALNARLTEMEPAA